MSGRRSAPPAGRTRRCARCAWPGTATGACTTSTPGRRGPAASSTSPAASGGWRVPGSCRCTPVGRSAGGASAVALDPRLEGAEETEPGRGGVLGEAAGVNAPPQQHVGEPGDLDPLLAGPQHPVEVLGGAHRLVEATDPFEGAA